MKFFGCGMKGLKIMLCLAFIVMICSKHSVAQTHSRDYAALISLTTGWKNVPQGWTGGDPCGNGWEGVACTNSRITTITLASMGMVGQLTGDLASLSKLQILDLSYNKGLTGPLPPNIGQLYELTTLILVGCGFSGRIPDSIGNLGKLVYLSLNTNGFTGKVPASIGNLRKLYWLDLSQNQLSGSIPVSNGNTPGLDLLVNTNHFHFGMNQLSGIIPPALFSSKMNLIHVLFDNNNLTGSIPSTLGLVQTLEAVRFDRNSLSERLPTNLNKLINLNELVLSNNAFTGPVPDLTGIDNLDYVDMSNNSFSASDVPQWFSTLQALTTVMMEQTGLQGELPAEFFSIPNLQTVVLRNNRLNQSLDFGTSPSQQLQLIDLQNNSISSLPRAPARNFTLLLNDNPYCKNSLTALPYCNNEQELDSTSSFLSPVFCVPAPCSSGMASSPNCKCAYPYTGTFILRAPSFSAFGSPTYFPQLQQSLLKSFTNMSLPVDAVSLSSAATDSFGYLTMKLQIFPAGQDYFNRTGVFSLGFVLSNQTYKPADAFEPYVFLADDYTQFEGKKPNSHTGAIIGAVIGSIVLLLLLVCAGGYAYYQRKRAQQAKKHANPFDAWDSKGAYGDIPQLKGAKFFSFEELRKCTNGFSEYNCVGAGGYGKVYKGILDDGQIVAVKRSQVGSMQGSREFKNEIELLSRVHHKNLVKLVGFCYDQGEQMLVYEYIANGTVLDSLSGTSGVQLDWIRRLMVVLGSARGLQYLHELADPPIIHRDIKSNNILLDERLTAKVADFGLSRLFGDSDKGYVTTQVKGTMGYLDPEYFMTNQLTEKSDVFSFGVVMLEIITARRPIQQGKYIVKVVKTGMDRSKQLYGLDEELDPMLVSSTPQLVGFERFVDLALNCAEESGMDRPTMGEVVKEIETILKQAGMNPNADSTSVSESYEGAGFGNAYHPYSDDSLMHQSMNVPLTKVVSE